jgi:hypothetical protein
MSLHRPRPFAIPSGAHHRTGLPLDRIPTRPLGTVRVIQDPGVPTLSAEVLAPLPKREPGENWPPPGADPAPVDTRTVFRPAIARALWLDYHRLPVFRATAITHRHADTERRMFAGLKMRKPPATTPGEPFMNITSLDQDTTIHVLESLIDDLAWNPLDEHCADCRASLTGWCDMHESRQAEAEKYERALMALRAAGDDSKARAVLATVPAVARLLPGNEVAA